MISPRGGAGARGRAECGGRTRVAEIPRRPVLKRETPPLAFPRKEMKMMISKFPGETFGQRAGQRRRLDCEICKYPDHERDEGREAGKEELDRHKTAAVTRGDLRVRIRILFRASSLFSPANLEQRAARTRSQTWTCASHELRSVSLVPGR